MKRLSIPLDQGLYSAMTFLTSIVVARNLTVDQFGIFALFFAALTMGVGFQRSVLSEPLLILAESHSRAGSMRAAVMRLVLASSLIGLTAAIVTTVLAQLSLGYLALGLICIAGPFIQDGVRFAFIANDRPQLALATDALSAVLQFTLLLSAARAASSSFSDYLVAWGLGSLAGPLLLLPVLAFGASREQRRKLDVPLIRDQNRLGRQFGGDYLLGVITVQGSLLVASGVSGVGAAAALRGADSLLGPYRVFLQAAPALLLPKWSSTHRRSQASGRRSEISRQLIAAVIPLWGIAAVGSTFLLLIPETWGKELLGESWLVARPILPLVLIGLFPITVSSLASVALKAMYAGRRLVAARLILVPISLVFGVGGAFLHGAVGAAAGALIASCVAAVIWVWMLVREENSTTLEMI